MPFAAACDQQDRPGRGVGLLQRRGKLARLPRRDAWIVLACDKQHGRVGSAWAHMLQGRVGVEPCELGGIRHGAEFVGGAVLPVWPEL